MRNLFIVIVTILAATISCTPKIKETIAIPEQAKSEIACIHIVNKNESLYQIAIKYGISQNDIIKMNPVLKTEKPKKGMRLYIPFATTEENIKTETPEIKQEIKDTVIVKEKPEYLKAALVLPFLLDKYAPSEQERMIEFYEGFLLAIEALKAEGHSFEIDVYDSGESTKSLDSLLNSGTLNSCDIIFGALYPKHNKQLADFAKSKNIPLILPFTVKDNAIYENSSAYITNALQKHIIKKCCEKFMKQFAEANIIFIKDEYQIEEKEFATLLAQEIRKNKRDYIEIAWDSLICLSDENGNNHVLQCMKQDSLNIFVPTSSKIETFSTILPTLLVLKRDTINSVPEFALFGYPEWQIYANNNLEAMYEVDTYFYTTFFTNNILPEATDIQSRYAAWYNRSMQNRYPRYGTLGYDIGYYFLKAICLYGQKMPENINNVKFTPAQSGFHFERKNNKGSYINNKIYFVRYSPDYKVTKIDLDK